MTAAGVTFYATLAAVPAALVAIRAAALIVGTRQTLELGRSLADALPAHVGAPSAVIELFEHGVDLAWWTALVALLPASLYGEGLRRALSQFGGPDERLIGWRGRLSIVPLLVLAPALLLVLLAATPTLNQLSRQGVRGVVVGVAVAFVADWVVTSPPLVWVFRVVSPDPPTWRAALLGGVLTASFVAGFLQGFVLFMSLPLDLGKPFGGLTAIGVLCALELWAWVLHLVVLMGYLGTRSFRMSRGGGPSGERLPSRISDPLEHSLSRSG